MTAFGALPVLSFMLVFCSFSEEVVALVGEEIFIGCYRNFRSRYSTNATLRECLSACVKRYYNFVAVQKISGCHCGDQVSNRIATSHCSANQNFAVYAIVPAYMGCYKDSLDRDLEHIVAYADMKNELCMYVCRLEKHRYAATQISIQCFCGKEFGKHGKAEEKECNMTCAGDSDQICGGSLRNSVYSIHHIPGLHLDFTDVFHCEGQPDSFGQCPLHRCQKGWRGKKCEQRDCNISNGHCGQNKCVDNFVRGEHVSECQCDKEIKKSTIYGSC